MPPAQPSAMPLDRRHFLLSAFVSGALAVLAEGAMAADIAPDPRLADLIGRMTVAEKAGQLHMEAALSYRQYEPDVARFNPFMAPLSPKVALARFDRQLDHIRAGGIGSLMTPMDVESMIRGQRAALASRMRIPLLFAADVIHGDRTVFPVPLAEAASFDPDLARRTARACAVEASARGVDVTFAPMVDIARDQRWGRGVEGAGEDVLLGTLFAAARVAGFQGQVGAPDSLLACVKHFAAYGAAESGLDYQGAALSERLLHEVYLPPFQAAFDAGAILVMASFNIIDGVPSTGNRRLLTDLLRGPMGFCGAVISDYEGEKELVAHGQAEDEADAVRIAIDAGCDVGMVSGLFPRYLPGLVQSGAVPMATLDRAVARFLEVKRRAGLFDDPFRRLDVRRSRRNAPPAHQALAREAARRSIVLLRNEGGLLPLPKSGRTIALIGPFGEDRVNLHGPWSPFAVDRPPISLADGVRAALADPSVLRVVAGCDIMEPLTGGVDAAVAAARAADVVILALGEGEAMSGESASRADIGLPAPQQALAQAVAATGKPVVVVLRHGRALVLDGAVRDAQAILCGWFLGTQTGPALADIVFGDHSPSGRLPVSFPLSTGQQPYYYAREASGRPDMGGAQLDYTAHYIGLPDAPLYPFGHGLTFGAVRYGETRASAAIWAPGTAFSVQCTVENAGSRAVEEVVQLYIHDRAAEVVQPVRKLIDFRRVALAPGQRVIVEFPVRAEQLGHLGQDARPVAGRGRFDAWIAPSARGGTPCDFTLG